jgi:hypothetical protein
MIHVKKFIQDHISLIIIVLIVFSSYVEFYRLTHNFNITYVEYRMHENDSIFHVVQIMNSYTPWGWDAHDFVALVQDKNHIYDISNIEEGSVIYIPIASLKEDKHAIKKLIYSTTN